MPIFGENKLRMQIHLASVHQKYAKNYASSAGYDTVPMKVTFTVPQNVPL